MMAEEVEYTLRFPTRPAKGTSYSQLTDQLPIANKLKLHKSVKIKEQDRIKVTFNEQSNTQIGVNFTSCIEICLNIDLYSPFRVYGVATVYTIQI